MGFDRNLVIFRHGSIPGDIAAVRQNAGKTSNYRRNPRSGELRLRHPNLPDFEPGPFFDSPILISGELLTPDGLTSDLPLKVSFR
jgi:hypothetical protein